MGERIKVVCPTCDGSGWSAHGPTPAGGSCASCRGEGEVWPERRERLSPEPNPDPDAALRAGLAGWGAEQDSEESRK